MTPSDLLTARPDLRLVWEDAQPFIRWSGTLPVELVAAIKANRNGVLDILYARDERMEIQAADGAASNDETPQRICIGSIEDGVQGQRLGQGDLQPPTSAPTPSPG